MTEEEYVNLKVGDILERVTDSGQSPYGYQTKVIGHPIDEHRLGIRHANGVFDNIFPQYWKVVGFRERTPTRFGKFIQKIEKEV